MNLKYESSSEPPVSSTTYHLEGTYKTVKTHIRQSRHMQDSQWPVSSVNPQLTTSSLLLVTLDTNPRRPLSLDLSDAQSLCDLNTSPPQHRTRPRRLIWDSQGQIRPGIADKSPKTLVSCSLFAERGTPVLTLNRMPGVRTSFFGENAVSPPSVLECNQVFFFFITGVPCS